MKVFRWGVFGTGAISAKFIAGLHAARSAEVTWVASRSLERAQRFARGAGVARAIEGYREALAEGGVDAVYIATPPSEHMAHALLCIEAGIPVLVEKPFAMTGDDATRIARAARASGVFAMEAMWTRFLPAAAAFKEEIARIGDIGVVSGSFGLSQRPDSDSSMFNPRLGGGAISHLGAYPLSLAQWLFGSPTTVQAIGMIGLSGVDEQVAFQLRYESGVLGSFFVSLRAWAPDDFQVSGSAGALAFQGSIVRPFGLAASRDAPRGADEASFGLKARLQQHGLTHRIAQAMGRSSRGPKTRLSRPYAGNGYHYEADEVRACVERGVVESRVMPLDDSIAVAATSDLIRSVI